MYRASDIARQRDAELVMHSTTPVAEAESMQFVCSEVWGGNRPVNRPVQMPGIRGRLYSKPCSGGSGGDIHYLSVCGSGLFSRLCIADVAGHGEEVAAVSRELHMLLRRYMNTTDQRRMLSELNKKLEAADTPIVTTAAAFSYYPPSRSLSYSYAGHPPAWLARAGTARWQQLELDPGPRGRLVNMPLSVDSSTLFTRRNIRVNCGDRLLILTDGVLEAAAADGELFGEKRVEALLNESRGMDPIALGDRLLDSLVEFTGDAALAHDDVTFVILEFVSGPRGPAVWHAIRNRIARPRGNSARLEPAVA
jgi:sigma-B regulation protein RsbU (phosphoserine phosphatase)